MTTFITDLDAFFKSFKSCMSPSGYEAFVALVTTEISIQMEKALLKGRFNRVSVHFKPLVNTIILVSFVSLPRSAVCSLIRNYGFL